MVIHVLAGREELSTPEELASPGQP